MHSHHRQDHAFCVDCGHPISRRAIRCRTCAGRARVGLPSAPPTLPDPPTTAELHPDAVAWILSHGYRYNAARLAQEIGVPVEQIRAIQDGAGGR